ncbi:hypothetical protein ES705_02605 [subsurface metagenome]
MSVATILAIPGVIFTLYMIYAIIISPRLKRNKLKRLYELIQNWYDEINQNLEKGLNLSLLNNKENKITQFIEDNGLGDYQLKFSKSFRKKFLKFCGIKKELQANEELFTKYSRCLADRMYLTVFWNSLVGAFYIFHREYSSQSGKAYFADISMRLKVLKMYLGIKVN